MVMVIINNILIYIKNHYVISIISFLSFLIICGKIGGLFSLIDLTSLFYSSKEIKVNTINLLNDKKSMLLFDYKLTLLKDKERIQQLSFFFELPCNEQEFYFNNVLTPKEKRYIIELLHNDELFNDFILPKLLPEEAKGKEILAIPETEIFPKGESPTIYDTNIDTNISNTSLRIEGKTSNIVSNNEGNNNLNSGRQLVENLNIFNNDINNGDNINNNNISNSNVNCKHNYVFLGVCFLFVGSFCFYSLIELMN